jgi:hypothetical protein
MNVELYVSSTDNLGTSHKPFQTNDVIGVNAGLNHPIGFEVTGFLHANSIQNVTYLDVGLGGNLVVDDSIRNVQALDVYETGVVKVKGDLVNVPNATLSFGATLELGGNAGFVFGSITSFQFGIGPSTLILDNPTQGSFKNQIVLEQNSIVELGHMKFDKADFIPSVPGSQTGKVQLTEHGKPVYQLANVVENPFPGTFLSVGHDRATGNDFVSYHT